MSKRTFSTVQDEEDIAFGDLHCSPCISEQPSKYQHAVPVSTGSPVIKCDLPPHDLLSFNSLEEYEVHYHQIHVNRCAECDGNFPSEHFLSLHLAEHHDPLTEVRRDRGEQTLLCFVEACDSKFATEAERAQHLVSFHGFPAFYDFDVIRNGLDGKTSLVRSKIDTGGQNSITRNRSLPNGSMLVTEGSTSAATSKARGQVDAESVNQITAGMSLLKFVPRSVARH